jgi:hypothetical protein
MIFSLPRALGEAAHRLWQHIERFPIPLEDALWIIEAYGDADVVEGMLAQRDKRGSSFPDTWENPRRVSHSR